MRYSISTQSSKFDCAKEDHVIYFSYHASRFLIHNEHGLQEKHARAICENVTADKLDVLQSGLLEKLTPIETEEKSIQLKWGADEQKKLTREGSSLITVFKLHSPDGEHYATLVSSTDVSPTVIRFSPWSTTVTVAQSFVTEQLFKDELSSQENAHIVAQYKLELSTRPDVVLGVYDKKSGLTTTAKQWLAAQAIPEPDSSFFDLNWSCGKTRIHHGPFAHFYRIVYVGLGAKDENEQNKVDKPLSAEEQFSGANAEIFASARYREAAIQAIQALIKDDKEKTRVVLSDGFNSFEQQVAEGLVLGSYDFVLDDGHVDAKNSLVWPKISFLSISGNAEHFTQGLIRAKAQKFAATLAETPANLMTPSIFCATVSEAFESNPLVRNVTIQVHDRKWAEQKGMGLFLSVTQGSIQEPRILEINYYGNSDKSQLLDLALVGKGITFDSGGISIKPSDNMKAMKGDMTGAAVVASTMRAIAEMKLPINVCAVAMLCENMPSSHATKPGDVFRAMNKKSVEVDNTDAEGRLVLADGLCYVSEKSPRIVINVATLTGAIGIALGGAAAGVFSSSNALWSKLEAAALHSNELLWRMPLLRDYYIRLMNVNVANMKNVGGREGGACTAAAFLSEFVDFTKVKEWAHVDIAGVALPGFQRPAMTGRPTRALVEMAYLLTK